LLDRTAHRLSARDFFFATEEREPSHLFHWKINDRSHSDIVPRHHEFVKKPECSLARLHPLNCQTARNLSAF